MSRTRIVLPDHFPYSMKLPVRITDLNYGNHVGNDRVLTLAHEARVGFLQHIGVSELDIGNGVGLIMATAELEFRAEIRFGDILQVSVGVRNLSRAGFDMIYRFVTERDGAEILSAAVVTGMVCYDYGMKKVVSIPESFREKLSDMHGG
jgi:acyl-CoA thioesterase FadM